MARILPGRNEEIEFQEVVSPPFLVGGEVGKKGLIEDAPVEGADQANLNAQSSPGSFFSCRRGMCESNKPHRRTDKPRLIVRAVKYRLDSSGILVNE
jgi:hypothetical protein